MHTHDDSDATQHDEQGWLGVPHRQWRLFIPAGTILILGLTTLIVPAVTVVLLAGIGAVAYLGAIEAEPMSPPPARVVTIGEGEYPSRSWVVAHDGPVAVDNNACPSHLPGDLEELTCTCAPEQTRGSGTVWGTDIYTSDSTLCRAALHTGAIDDTGGEIEVRTAPGCASYVGALKNGVRTMDYGSWGGSFYFPASSEGVCPAEDEDDEQNSNLLNNGY